MVPAGSDESKLRTFQGPIQAQISSYKDFYMEFHNPAIQKIYHIYIVTFLLFSFFESASHLIGYEFYILKENLQSMNFGMRW